jgi:hypothetical protein
VSDLLPSIGGTLDVTSILLVPLILCLGGSDELATRAMRALRILCKLHLHKRWSLAASAAPRSKRAVRRITPFLANNSLAGHGHAFL